MFKGRIISRSNINGKLHTFQKDFDDYDDYQAFIEQNPEYDSPGFFRNPWGPWSVWDGIFTPIGTESPALPADTRYLPEGVDLEKYEKRRYEKRQSEAEKSQKRYSLERSRDYLKDYLEENPEDPDAKKDLEKVEKGIKELV